MTRDHFSSNGASAAISSNERATKLNTRLGWPCAPVASRFARGLKPYLSGEGAPWSLGIHPNVHPGRTRCMRHDLPHARRIGGGMFLLLLPLLAFGHYRTGKFIDCTVPDSTLDHPITTSVDHSRHLAVARYIFTAVPGVPLRIDLGRDRHTANLQHRRHATLRHLHAVRVDLFADNASQILPDDGRRD